MCSHKKNEAHCLDIKQPLRCINKWGKKQSTAKFYHLYKNQRQKADIQEISRKGTKVETSHYMPFCNF